MVRKGGQKFNFFASIMPVTGKMSTQFGRLRSTNEVVTSFEDITKIGREHFGEIYKKDKRVNIAEIVQMTSHFMSFVLEEDNERLMEKVSKGDLEEILYSFKKDKSLGLNGWLVEFFIGFQEIIEDLKRVVEDSRVNGRMLATFNATFIALIPKSDNPYCFEEFRYILLCNCVYTIIAKIIVLRVKNIFFEAISHEHHGFLFDKHIYVAIGVAQEVLHSIKARKMKAMVIKIDLSKECDSPSWLYPRLMLIYMGFCT
jgi:hypothetical protein